MMTEMRMYTNSAPASATVSCPSQYLSLSLSLSLALSLALALPLSLLVFLSRARAEDPLLSLSHSPSLSQPPSPSLARPLPSSFFFSIYPFYPLSNQETRHTPKNGFTVPNLSISTMVLSHTKKPATHQRSPR